MIITPEQEKKLLEIIPTYQDLLKKEGFRGLLDEIAMEITDAFDRNQEPTARSREIERLYDALYYQNKERKE